MIVFKDVTSEKLDAVVKLANAAAHELRQPLQVIISGLLLLQDQLHDDRNVKDELKYIKDSCYRMNEIIEKISHITRYRTKRYIRNEMILDLDGSSGSAKEQG